MHLTQPILDVTMNGLNMTVTERTLEAWLAEEVALDRTAAVEQ
ncbi:MAG: hypothetical protein QM750_30260 [Rubrivivax sp.]